MRARSYRHTLVGSGRESYYQISLFATLPTVRRTYLVVAARALSAAADKLEMDLPCLRAAVDGV